MCRRTRKRTDLNKRWKTCDISRRERTGPADRSGSPGDVVSQHVFSRLRVSTLAVVHRRGEVKRLIRVVRYSCHVVSRRTRISFGRKGDIMAKRRSLHIGMNFVDPKKYGGWDGALSGCVNDANAMHDVAVSRGLEPQMLLHADATAAAV